MTMPIGDIQLTQAAMPEPQQDARISIGEQPTDPGNKTPEELEDKPLSRQRVEGFLFEIMHQPAWRKEADRCADYYDNNQLSAETVEKLKERGQPPLISNFIKPTIDTVLGIEALSRTDWRVRGEEDGSCPDDLAEALSLKLKHAETESGADRAISEAYAAQCKSGLGWVEVGQEKDPFKCPYRAKYVHRREIFWDWRAEQPDLSDALYLMRRRWLELDHAIALMPQYAQLFNMTANGWTGFDPILEQGTNLIQSWELERDTKLSTTDWRDIQRQRVCLNEIWYRKWVRAYVLQLPNGRVVQADFDNPRHNEAIMAGVVQVSMATFQKVRLAWFAGPHFLYDIPSPYKHNYFPYVPFFGYREDNTGAPYGMIRTMISPQDEINARKSKMLWGLNSRRVVADSDVVLDHVKAAQEVARADAYVILNANRKPGSGFNVEPGGDLAAQQFQVMQDAKQEISEVSGIHKTQMGQQTGATSGLAVNSLAEQGRNTQAVINDNKDFSRRMVGEMLFSMIQEKLSGRESVVEIGEGRNKKQIVLNQQSIDETTGQPTVLNDVSRVRAKVVLGDVPSSPTFRNQQLMMISEIVKSLPPELQVLMLDYVIELTDMPKKQEAAERIRNAVGIKDPEQQKAEESQQAEEMARQKGTEAKMLALDVAERAAKIRKLNAESDRLQMPPDKPKK